MKKYFLIILALFTTAACSTMQQNLGIKTTMPDEYQVPKNRPLEVPPHLQTQSYKNQVSNKSKTLSEQEKALLKEVE